MTKAVTVLGTGIMGAGMARSLIRAGLDVTVWNRSAEKARPRGHDGARVADDVASAVSGADGVAFPVGDEVEAHVFRGGVTGEAEDDGAGCFVGGEGADGDLGLDGVERAGVAKFCPGPGGGDVVVGDVSGGGFDGGPVPLEAPFSAVVVDVGCHCGDPYESGDGDGLPHTFHAQSPWA